MPDHHPPHVYLDDTWYMITASTWNRSRLMASDRAKAFLRDKLRDLVLAYGIGLKAWVILDNHYHLLLKTRSGEGLSGFVGRLHGSTSRRLNQWDATLGRKVWHNYWDKCVRDERGLWTRFNYIHQNPVKHSYAVELALWPYSSYHYYLRTKGADWLADCWSSYPVVDYLQGDDF